MYTLPHPPTVSCESPISAIRSADEADDWNNPRKYATSEVDTRGTSA